MIFLNKKSHSTKKKFPGPYYEKVEKKVTKFLNIKWNQGLISSYKKYGTKQDKKGNLKLHSYENYLN